MRNAPEFYREGGFTPAEALGSVLMGVIGEYRAITKELGRFPHVLDVGCGANALLASELPDMASYTACDIVERADLPHGEYFSIDLNQETLAERVADKRFDVVICSEVIEHVFSPDALLRDLASVLAPGGRLILSTPNLAYYMNRFLLLFGIHPFFLENSSEVKLGRKFKIFGQGNPTEGHLRVFTYGSLTELIPRCGLRIVDVKANAVWNFPPDRIVAKVAPRFAPDLMVIAARASE